MMRLNTGCRPRGQSWLNWSWWPQGARSQDRAGARTALSAARPASRQDRMNASWKEVRRASIPLVDLPVLAELRGNGEIRVLIAGEIAWVSWNPESDGMREMLVRQILPLAEAVLYTKRADCWYRLGEHLPRFDVPDGDESLWSPLERTIFPQSIVAARPRRAHFEPTCIQIVRDARMPSRPATAMRCTTGALCEWAQRDFGCAACAQGWLDQTWNGSIVPGGSVAPGPLWIAAAARRRGAVLGNGAARSAGVPGRS